MGTAFLFSMKCWCSECGPDKHSKVTLLHWKLLSFILKPARCVTAGLTGRVAGQLMVQRALPPETAVNGHFYPGISMEQE